ncbi:MAG: NAD(P)-dependent oxidoreductase [Bacilli bacterium]
MKVLLTGAAGSVGFEALKQLVLKKYEVTVIELDNKKNRKKLKPFQDSVKIVYGSINDSKLVKQLVKGMDAIIHLAAIIPPLADKEPELTRQVNFFGTKNIVEAILKQDKKPFLLYSSSVSVYGDRLDDYFIEVSDPLKPSLGDYYAQTKIAVEQLIMEADIPYTIFRLTGIMGHPATDPLMFHMPLDTKLEIASTIDTGGCFVKALEHLDELKGHIYNLSGGLKCRTTYREFLISMFKIYGLNIHYLKDVAFATANFHCGYFKDSYKLNDILNFQNDTLDTYYARVKKETKGIIRFFSKIFSRPIIYFLTKKSDPLKAKKENNKNLLERFFKK